MGNGEGIRSGPLVQKQNPEQEWDKVEAEIRAGLDKLVADDPYGASRDEVIANFLLCEKTFFIKVLSTAARAAKARGDDVTILFDVDQTLGVWNGEDNQSPNQRMLIRPAVLPLLRLCKEVGYKMGLLTSRGELERQVQEEKNLGALRDYLSTDLLFSDRDYSVDLIKNTAQAIASTYGGPSGVVNEELIFAAEPGTLPTEEGGFTKLAALIDIRRKISHGPIVVVDDFPYAEFLNEANDLYGVSLNFRKKGSGAFAPSAINVRH